MAAAAGTCRVVVHLDDALEGLRRVGDRGVIERAVRPAPTPGTAGPPAPTTAGGDPTPTPLRRIIQVENPQVIRQLEHPQSAANPAATGTRASNPPSRAKLPTLSPPGRLSQPRQVPDVIIRVIDPAAALRSMLVQRMARLSRRRGRQEWEDAIDEHSGCPAPGLRVQRFEHRGGPRQLQHLERPRPVEVRVRAFEPSPGRRLTPHQTSTCQHMLEVDQQRCRPRPRSLLALDPPRGLGPVHPDDRRELSSTELTGQVPHPQQSASRKSALPRWHGLYMWPDPHRHRIIAAQDGVTAM